MVDADRFLRDYTKDKDELAKIALQETGLTDPALNEASLADIAAVAAPQMECKRVDAQVQELVSIKTVPTAPHCNQVLDLEYVPKKQ